MVTFVGKMFQNWIIWFFFKGFINRSLQENLNNFRRTLFFFLPSASSGIKLGLWPRWKALDTTTTYLLAQTEAPPSMWCSDEPWGSSTTEEWVLQKLLCCLLEHNPSWLSRPRKGDLSSIKWNRKSPKLQESPNHLRTVGFILHCWLYSQVLWSGLSPSCMIFAVPSGTTFSPGLC